MSSYVCSRSSAKTLRSQLAFPSSTISRIMRCISILPTIVLSILFIAGWSRYLRSSMLDTVKQDYVRTARSKGLSSRSIFFRHALRNALIPFITVVAIDFGGIASGAVITETIFAWPGIGYFFYDALTTLTIPYSSRCYCSQPPVSSFST